MDLVQRITNVCIADFAVKFYFRRSKSVRHKTRAVKWGCFSRGISEYSIMIGKRVEEERVLLLTAN